MKSIDSIRAELQFALARYRKTPSPSVAGNVAGSLRELVLHPDFHADIQERCVCKRLQMFWQMLAD